MPSTHIDPTSIDLLHPVLGFLRNVGVGTPLNDDIWGWPVVDQSTYLTNGACFVDTMNTLQHLRGARSTLSLLLGSLDRKLASLRSATYPAVLACGIEHLPNEILGHIFTLAAAANWKIALRISWVSRRFRSVALSTPRLWHVLPHPFMDQLNKEVVACFLERSKNVGITVELPLMITEEYEQNPEWDEAIKMLLEHKHRWKEVTVDLTAIYYAVTDDEGNVFPESTLVKLEFPKATLDAVEYLYIGDSPRRFTWPDYGSDYERYDDASPEFYSSWNFPNLKTLVSDMRIPPAGIFPSLTEFSLDLSIHAPSEPRTDEPSHLLPPLDRLAAFLNSVRTLQTFKLTAGEYPYGSIQVGITLPSLTTLHLENRYAHPKSLHLLRTVSSAMHIPAVETISVFVSIRKNQELIGNNGKGWFSSFFPETQDYTKLKRFKLEYMVECDVASRTLRELERFPVLEEIEMSTSSAPIISESTAMELREKTALKHVRFRDVHLQHESAVREYVIEDDSMSLRSYLENR